MSDTTGGAPRTATITVLFCDLVGSTERQARMGDDAADEFRRGFLAVLGEAVGETGGEVVKNTGDGLMVVFRASAVDAVTCASKMHDRVEALDVGEPAFVRVGVSAGEAASESGDWFGTPVVEAARLCAKAEPGQTLVSELVRGLVGSRGGHQFRSVGALTLKGLAAPVPSAAVIRTPIAAPQPTRPRPRPRSSVLVVGVAVVLAGAGVAALLARNSGATRRVLTPVRYLPRFESSPCRQEPNWTCGDVVVPEDRTRPGGRWLHLPVTLAPAREATSAQDPTISIALGWPDDVATSPARDHSELISIETRLADAPNPTMACPEFEPVASLHLTRPAHDPDFTGAGQPALRACHDRLLRSGVALAQYTIDDAANDVIDLARALHLTRVNLVASDPATPVALSVVRDVPSLVRTMTLLNVSSPEAAVLDPTAQLAAAFDQYIALCNASPQCAHAYPDLGGAFRRDWAYYNAHPQVVDATDPNTGVRHPILVNGDRLALGLAAALGNPSVDPSLAAAIASPPLGVVAGDILYSQSTLYSHDYPWAILLSYQCSYPFALSPAHKVSSETRPELAGVDVDFFQWACAAWAVPQAIRGPLAEGASTIPTLLVVAPLDAQASPPADAALIADLPHAIVLVLPTLGSSAIQVGGPACLNALRRAFLANPTRHLNTADCSKRSPPINFVVPTS
jgi:class 3 adenylate cyclase